MHVEAVSTVRLILAVVLLALVGAAVPPAARPGDVMVIG